MRVADCERFTHVLPDKTSLSGKPKGACLAINALRTMDYVCHILEWVYLDAYVTLSDLLGVKHYPECPVIRTGFI